MKDPDKNRASLAQSTETAHTADLARKAAFRALCFTKEPKPKKLFAPVKREPHIPVSASRGTPETRHLVTVWHNFRQDHPAITDTMLAHAWRACSARRHTYSSKTIATCLNTLKFTGSVPNLFVCISEQPDKFFNHLEQEGGSVIPQDDRTALGKPLRLPLPAGKAN